jgi:hypothetical protein
VGCVSGGDGGSGVKGLERLVMKEGKTRTRHMMYEI